MALTHLQDSSSWRAVNKAVFWPISTIWVGFAGQIEEDKLGPALRKLSFSWLLSSNILILGLSISVCDADTGILSALGLGRD